MTLDNFARRHYQEHNAARLRHLDSLGLPLQNRRVLEVGSGPGDHTAFYVERECSIVSVDARQECLDALKARFPQVETHRIDMNEAALSSLGVFDVVHCYGLLYHLARPEVAIEAMADSCGDAGVLLLETCVSAGDTLDTYPIAERADSTQAVGGIGCRPTRAWVFATLRKNFKFVYQTRTQPNHPEFPLDWTVSLTGPLSRAVFVASGQSLDEALFSPHLLDRQNT